MDKTYLEWEITPEEAKGRMLQSFPVVASMLAGFAVIMAIQARSWVIILVFAVIVGLFYIYALVFSKFKLRRFQISENGVTISKGDRQKTYSWEEFDFFFAHSLVINRNPKPATDFRTRAAVNDIISTSGKLTEISGQTFYLKKKKQTFWDKFVKTFVVVYSEPDNSAAVQEALIARLPFKTMDNFTEAGMIKYEFK